MSNLATVSSLAGWLIHGSTYFANWLAGWLWMLHLFC
jgi:hypothetical protein